MRCLLTILYNLLVLPGLILGGILLYPFSGRIRRGWGLRLDSRRNILTLSPRSGRWIWLHVASVGEFLMAGPYIQEIRRQEPGLKVLCTYSSDSLSDWLATNPQPFDEIHLLPWDSITICRKLFASFRPRVLVLMRYDLWPNLIFGAKHSGASVLLMGARLRTSRDRRAQAGFFRRSVLKTFLAACDRILVADAASFGALEKILATSKNLVLAPQGPAPAIAARRSQEQNCRPSARSDSRIRIVLGSCYENEVATFFRAYDLLDRSLQERVEVCFAPHRNGEKLLRAIQAACARRQLPVQRASKMRSGLAEEGAWLILDSVGKLFSAYRGASLAWVGNPGTGVHNVLEPLAWEVPVIFFAPYSNSPDAQSLKALNAATVIETSIETSIEASIEASTETSIEASSEEGIEASTETRNDAAARIATLIGQLQPRSAALNQQVETGAAFFRACCLEQNRANEELGKFLSQQFHSPERP